MRVPEFPKFRQVLQRHGISSHLDHPSPRSFGKCQTWGIINKGEIITQAGKQRKIVIFCPRTHSKGYATKKI